MPGMDVFESNAFSMQTLTAALLDQAHVPLRLGQLGIFESNGIRTIDVSVEKKGNTLVLVQTSPRGGPAGQNTNDSRELFKIPTARIALDAAAQVISQSDRPMGAKALIAAMADQGLWQSAAGKTPHATLYAAIHREIAKQGDKARFQKVDRGMFAFNKVTAE